MFFFNFLVVFKDYLNLNNNLKLSEKVIIIILFVFFSLCAWKSQKIEFLKVCFKSARRVLSH